MEESKVVISKKLVAINSISFMLVYLLHATIFLWVQHYLLQKVSPEEFSVFVVIGGFFFLMPVLLEVFIGSTLRYVVNHYAKGELDQVTSVVSSILPVLLLVSCIIFAAAALSMRYVETLFVIPPGLKYDAQLMLLLVAIWAVLNLVLSPFTVGIHALQKYVLSNAIAVLGQILKIALLFILLFGVSTRALWVAVATTAAEIFCLLVRVVISIRIMPQLRFSAAHVRLDVIPRLLSFGIWNSMVILSRYLQNHATLIVMNRFGTPIDVNCFGLGRSMNRQAWHLWDPAKSSLSSPLTAMYATKSWGRLRRAYCMGGRYAIWLVMGVVTPLMVFRHEFVRLYAGRQYEQAADILFFWLLPIPFQLVNVMLPQLAQAKAKLKDLALRMLFVQLAGLAGILIVVWQLRGKSLDAAMAFAFLSIAGELVLIWPHGCKLADVSISEILREIVIPGLVPVVIGVVALMFIRNVYHPDTWWRITVGSAGGAIVYLCGVLIAFTAEDQRGLMGLLRRNVVQA